MFRRKIYDQLLEWRRNDSRECALLIGGARFLLWVKDRKEMQGISYLPIYMAPCLVEE